MFYNLNNPKILNIITLKLYYNIINEKIDENKKLNERIDLRLI